LVAGLVSGSLTSNEVWVVAAAGAAMGVAFGGVIGGIASLSMAEDWDLVYHEEGPVDLVVTLDDREHADTVISLLDKKSPAGLWREPV
jgi:hypothetical protein